MHTQMLQGKKRICILRRQCVLCNAMQGDENAAKKFQEVSKAYDTLRDPQKRQQYDSMGADGYERMAENGGAGWSPVHPHCDCYISYSL